MVRASHQAAQQAGELGDEHARRIGLRADERRDGGEGVEEEVRVNLIRERLDLRGEQQRFLFLQPMLDARVVPDLDGRRHAHHRRQQHEQHRPGPRWGRGEDEQAAVINPAEAERLAEELERNRREEQHDLPVGLQRPDHPPGAAGQAGEDERRKVPDGFLRADLADAAAREAAADGKRQRGPFAHEQGREPQHAPDRRPSVGSGDEPRQKRSFHREVGGVVVQEQPGPDAGGERHAEAEGEDEPVRPGAALEDEDVPEPPVPHQHRRQGRHDGDFGEERGKQHILGREQPWALHGFT